MIAVSRTNRGMVRPNNEDSILVREPDLYAIADGMGGADAGEVASYEAVHQLGRLDLSGLGRKEILPFLERSIQNINKKIWELSREKENFTGMGTTLTAVYLPNSHSAFVAHVGDSRLYLLENGTFRQLTEDHSFVMQLVKQGEITREEMRTHPRRNEITRAVGITSELKVDTGHLPFNNGAIILLCSDGLTNMLTDEEIKASLQAHMTDTLDVCACVDDLMEKTYAAGAEDNVSVIIAYNESLQNGVNDNHD